MIHLLLTFIVQLFEVHLFCLLLIAGALDHTYSSIPAKGSKSAKRKHKNKHHTESMDVTPAADTLIQITESIKILLQMKSSDSHLSPEEASKLKVLLSETSDVAAIVSTIMSISTLQSAIESYILNNSILQAKLLKRKKIGYVRFLLFELLVTI